MQGMKDLEDALPEYEFVYARGGYNWFNIGRLWVPVSLRLFAVVVVAAAVLLPRRLPHE